MAYSKLHLYFGNVPSDGVREGHLDLHSKDLGKIEHYKEALGVVQKYLKMDFFGSIPVAIGSPSLFKSEEHANQFIESTAKSFAGSYGLYEIRICMHGKIGFDKYLRMQGWNESQKGELIEKIKSIQFDFEPDEYLRNMKPIPEAVSIDDMLMHQITFHG